jgi:hypothetical protein
VAASPWQKEGVSAVQSFAILPSGVQNKKANLQSWITVGTLSPENFRILGRFPIEK